MSLKLSVMQRINEKSFGHIWTAVDFLDLGDRFVIDKVLQRLVHSKVLIRVDRGFYSLPRINKLTASQEAIDYRQVIAAISRRDQVRMLIDGMTCANDLGLTNAVPGQVIVHTDGRLRPIHIGNLVIQFKLTAPAKLFWADRPAMRVVQSLYWFHHELKSKNISDEIRIKNRLIQLLKTPEKGEFVRKDLEDGLFTLPSWMQKWIREWLLI